MKVAQIKTERPFRSYDWRQYQIQSYGEDNAFPQAIQEVVQASKTGSACLSIYADFIYGQGFLDESLGTLPVNFRNDKLSRVLRMVVQDFARWHGFALHVNYNANYKVSSVSHMPFECLRLSLPDDFGFVGSVAYHPDWGHRSKIGRWKPSDIERFNLFNPDPAIVAQQVKDAGGWNGYKGQVLYFSGDAEGLPIYPIPIYIAEVTDMRTEEGLANVSGRNVCSNFLAAGMVVDIKDEEQDEEQLKSKQKLLQSFQGDENTSQLLYVQVRDKEQVPSFVKFTGENYDKAFTSTQEKIPENIGQSFKQPPILRAVDVGANFGADLMTNAYRYYNSVTVRERQQLEEVFTEVFKYWWAGIGDREFTIQALTYSAGLSVADKVGKDNMAQLLEVAADTSLTVGQRRDKLIWLYGLTEEESINIVPENDNPDPGPAVG